VILFVNRVRPGRFALSLLLNGVVFACGLSLWAGAIWLSGRILFPNQIPLQTVVRLVSLGAAPYVFGFLVLLPYLGSIIGRALAVWSVLVVLAALSHLAGGQLLPALACSVLGWLLLCLLHATIGTPINAAATWLTRHITNTDMRANVQDILVQFAGEELPDMHFPKGGS
jgi:hypothetical protein